ncbi:hypothetical protein MTO96_001552 [Rhipicephalus appendiculatus]
MEPIIITGSNSENSSGEGSGEVQNLSGDEQDLDTTNQEKKEEQNPAPKKDDAATESTEAEAPQPETEDPYDESKKKMEVLLLARPVSSTAGALAASVATVNLKDGSDEHAAYLHWILRLREKKEGAIYVDYVKDDKNNLMQRARFVAAQNFRTFEATMEPPNVIVISDSEEQNLSDDMQDLYTAENPQTNEQSVAGTSREVTSTTSTTEEDSFDESKKKMEVLLLARPVSSTVGSWAAAMATVTMEEGSVEKASYLHWMLRFREKKEGAIYVEYIKDANDILTERCHFVGRKQFATFEATVCYRKALESPQFTHVKLNERPDEDVRIRKVWAPQQQLPNCGEAASDGARDRSSARNKNAGRECGRPAGTDGAEMRLGTMHGPPRPRHT